MCKVYVSEHNPGKTEEAALNLVSSVEICFVAFCLNGTLFGAYFFIYMLLISIAFVSHEHWRLAFSEVMLVAFLLTRGLRGD